MGRFLLRRITYALLALVVATLIVFVLSRLQGDPRNLFIQSGYASDEAWEAWGKRLNLDKPLVVQYGLWLVDAARGDFGDSIRTGYPAFEMIQQRFPATLQLGGAAFLFAVGVGIPLGVLSAVRRGSVWDLIGRTFALLGQAAPPYWLGIILILFFAVQLGWLPTSQRGGPLHYILPAVTLGWLPTAGLLRMVRSSMLEVLDSEYITFARARGVSNISIIWKHGLRNAMIAPLTYSTVMLIGFINGTVVTETVFAWPGLGHLMVTAIANNDFPVMTGGVLVFTLMYQIGILLLDLSYVMIDPRIKYA